MILILLYACRPAAAQSQNPASQLVQYVRDARKAGLDDDRIRKNAEEAGWTADAVASAMLAAVLSPGNGSGKTPPPELHPPVVGKEGGQVLAQPDASAAPPHPTAKDRKAPDDYEIGAGDVLHIAVWKEPDASVQSVVVRPDGKISMPLLKEVPVLGLTVVQAEQNITHELSKFLTAPDVTVVVEGINSKKIYITGAVKKEGPIPYTYRMTVLQALTEAGGLTDYAKRKKIYVLHDENGRQFTFPFDYDAVLKGRAHGVKHLPDSRRYDSGPALTGCQR